MLTLFSVSVGVFFVYIVLIVVSKTRLKHFVKSEK